MWSWIEFPSCSYFILTIASVQAVHSAEYQRYVWIRSHLWTRLAAFSSTATHSAISGGHLPNFQRNLCLKWMPSLPRGECWTMMKVNLNVSSLDLTLAGKNRTEAWQGERKKLLFLAFTGMAAYLKYLTGTLRGRLCKNRAQQKRLKA